MKAFLNWSGGKDSAYCLHTARLQGLPVEALVTTTSGGRISMHGVPQALLQRQAASVQLPLHIVPLAEGGALPSYEEAVSRSSRALRAGGFDTAVSGDLFLEDLRRYREDLYGRDGLAASFPLWGLDTSALLRDFIALGFRAIVVAVNEAHLDKSFCGRFLDESFINDLPAGVDPCGERGEYHSFVFDGPVFSAPIAFTRGELVYRTYPAPVQDDCFSAEPLPAAGFYFCELVPA